MPDLLVRSFTPFLLAFQPCFTQPSFSSFWALTCAWILCSGRRSLTRVIQSGQLGRFKHYCSFHRFFSQARWNLDDLGYCVFQLLLPFCPEILTGALTRSADNSRPYPPIRLPMRLRPWSTLWRANPDATSGAPTCITIRCAPLRNDPSFPLATVGSSSRYTSRFHSLPARSGPSPSSSACIANGRNRHWLPAAMESRKRNKQV